MMEVLIAMNNESMSSVEVRDGKGIVLGKVRVGDTKLQALERLFGREAGRFTLHSLCKEYVARTDNIVDFVLWKRLHTCNQISH